MYTAIDLTRLEMWQGAKDGLSLGWESIKKKFKEIRQPGERKHLIGDLAIGATVSLHFNFEDAGLFASYGLLRNHYATPAAVAAVTTLAFAENAILAAAVTRTPNTIQSQEVEMPKSKLLRKLGRVGLTASAGVLPSVVQEMNQPTTDNIDIYSLKHSAIFAGIVGAAAAFPPVAAAADIITQPSFLIPAVVGYAAYKSMGSISSNDILHVAENNATQEPMPLESENIGSI